MPERLHHELYGSCVHSDNSSRTRVQGRRDEKFAGVGNQSGRSCIGVQERQPHWSARFFIRILTGLIGFASFAYAAICARKHFSGVGAPGFLSQKLVATITLKPFILPFQPEYLPWGFQRTLLAALRVIICTHLGRLCFSGCFFNPWSCKNIVRELYGPDIWCPLGLAVPPLACLYAQLNWNCDGVACGLCLPPTPTVEIKVVHLISFRSTGLIGGILDR